MNRFIYSLVAIYLRILIGHLSRKSSYSTMKRIALELALLRKQIQIRDNSTTKRKTLSKWDRLEIASLMQIGDAKALARRCAILFKPETFLKCHRYFVKRKYSKLYGEKPKKRGPKGKSKPLVNLVIEIKKNNPDYGCEKIAELLTARGHPISHSTIRRILKKYGYDDERLKTGPSSCLPRARGRGAALDVSFNRLWVTDFFKVESSFLQTYVVMVVMDVYSQKIVGFAARPYPLTGTDVCVMFNSILGNSNPPRKLCHDRDPLFRSKSVYKCSF